MKEPELNVPCSIGGFSPQTLQAVLRRAASRYDDAEFQSYAKRLPPLPATDRTIIALR